MSTATDFSIRYEHMKHEPKEFYRVLGRFVFDQIMAGVDSVATLLPDHVEMPDNRWTQKGHERDWVDNPRTTRRGMIIPITKDAIEHDRTAKLAETCQKVGRYLASNKATRLKRYADEHPEHVGQIVWFVNWPITLEERNGPPPAHAEEIVYQYKVSECGYIGLKSEVKSPNG